MANHPSGALARSVEHRPEVETIGGCTSRLADGVASMRGSVLAWPSRVEAERSSRPLGQIDLSVLPRLRAASRDDVPAKVLSLEPDQMDSSALIPPV